GITAGAAIAVSWGAAHALARYRADPVLIGPAGKTAELLSPLPLEALRLQATTAAALRDLGLVSIGDIASAPRAPLTRRFGPEVCRRLDQAFGAIAEPITPYRPAEMIETRRSFAEPIAAAETIARYIGKLVEALCVRLEEQGVGARRLDLLCRRVDDNVEPVRIGLARPVRDAKRLTRLLRDKIESIDPGFGIEVMSLIATVTEPLPARQTASALVETPEPDLSGLIDTLVNRVGARAVYRFAPVA